LGEEGRPGGELAGQGGDVVVGLSRILFSRKDISHPGDKGKRPRANQEIAGGEGLTFSTVHFFPFMGKLKKASKGRRRARSGSSNLSGCHLSFLQSAPGTKR